VYNAELLHDTFKVGILVVLQRQHFHEILVTEKVTMIIAEAEVNRLNTAVGE